MGIFCLFVFYPQCHCVLVTHIHIHVVVQRIEAKNTEHIHTITIQHTGVYSWWTERLWEPRKEQIHLIMQKITLSSTWIVSGPSLSSFNKLNKHEHKERIVCGDSYLSLSPLDASSSKPRSVEASMFRLRTGFALQNRHRHRKHT